MNCLCIRLLKKQVVYKEKFGWSISQAKQPLDQIGNPSQTKKYRDKNKMFLMEGLRNAEDVQNQEISDIVCLVQSGRAENGSVQHIFERGENLHWLFCEVEEPLMRLISGTEMDRESSYW